MLDILKTLKTWQNLQSFTHQYIEILKTIWKVLQAFRVWEYVVFDKVVLLLHQMFQSLLFLLRS